MTFFALILPHTVFEKAFPLIPKYEPNLISSSFSRKRTYEFIKHLVPTIDKTA